MPQNGRGCQGAERRQSTRFERDVELPLSIYRDRPISWCLPGQVLGRQQPSEQFRKRVFGDVDAVSRSTVVGGEIYVNPEMSGGAGFSHTTGVAGFPNGEVYRVDATTPRVFIARAFVRQQITIGDDETEYVAPDQNQIGEKLASSRLTVTAGRFSLTDIFDDNAYSHDPRTQFLNWAIWTGGAWDYAADTRGYNWGVAAEVRRPDWILRSA